MKFDVDYISGEAQLKHIIYDNFRLLIKLWVDEKSQQRISQNNLINIAN